jgi:hypothetical protein
MADPRNSHRPTMAQMAIRMASAVAANRAAPHSASFWDDDDGVPQVEAPMAQTEMDAEDADREQWLSERERESRRDEMQYRTAFRTAFELGMKAGKMQRAEPLPCAACERRKERNRIAAQASRQEKRRLERTQTAEPPLAPTRKRRSTGSPDAVPPPLLPGTGRTYAFQDTNVQVQAVNEEDEDGNNPPPF